MPDRIESFSLQRLPALGLLLLLFAFAEAGHAQEAALPFTPIPLDDLSAFQEPDENWTVAGEVRVDRRREGDLRPVSGTGVLVNRPSQDHAANLFTEMEHGDIELELDFLVPRGSNSGVYLMGRYEIQVLDSWGTDPPHHSDAGGIYQRWDESRGEGREGYEGHPPRVNASRAPGLWQHYRILFQAPRFDEDGRKIADARFVRVEHNGVVIHENVEVTGPTRAAAFDDERPTGPLMLQGDHGPVAYRNLRFKRYDAERARITDLQYRAYEEPTLDLTDATLLDEGMAPAVAGDRAGDAGEFGIVYEGQFHAPTAGDYLFDLGLDWVEPARSPADVVRGAGRLYVADREVVRHEGRAPHATGTVTLDPGIHTFRLVFFKDDPWRDPWMTLHVEGPGFARLPLHDPGSLPPVDDVGAITVGAHAAPVVQRVFMPHGDTKRTHAAAVGDPTGVHYTLDLPGGALLNAWRGPFIETTPMWHERGNDQIALPLGSVVTFDGAPAIAALAAADAPWPTTVANTTSGGYILDAEGRPTFTYTIAGARVEDALRPAEDGRALHRRLRITDGSSLSVRLAEGTSIVPAEGGGYRVDDAYYVEPDAGLTPTVRSIDGRDELVTPVPDDTTADVGYTIIW